MKIERLKEAEYQGKKFTETYHTGGYYDIEALGNTFTVTHKSFESIKCMPFECTLFEEWLDEPVAFGAFDENTLLGIVEGFLEKWNNRYRISNIFIFKEKDRRSGLGNALINKMVDEARTKGARMIVLETQSCNEKAIAFYKKQGFQIIGFDLYAYTNDGPNRHEVRIEMGMAL